MKKTIGWIAGALILAGIILCAAAAAFCDFGSGGMNTMSLVRKTYSVGQDFSAVSISDESSNVRLLPSGDGECRVICSESENGKLHYDVTVSEGVLTVQRIDQRDLLERVGISFGGTDLELYLPKTEYDRLTVRTSSGGIRVPEDFRFGEAQGEASSGGIIFSASVDESLTLNAASGSISVSGVSPRSLSASALSGSVTLEAVNAEETLYGETSSGTLSLTGVRCGELTAQSTSGGIHLTDVVASGTVTAQSSSGSVRLNQCDGAELFIRTSSGGVSGTLLSDKVFLTETASGSVRVPRTVTGGACEITTSSGSIDISIQLD